MQEYSNSFLNSPSTTKAYSSEKPRKRALSISREAKTLNEILETYATEMASNGVNPASDGHMGYIPGGGIYSSALSDYLADVTNEYAGIPSLLPEQ